MNFENYKIKTITAPLNVSAYINDLCEQIRSRDALLALMEWSGDQRGQSSAYSRDGGSHNPACPMCYGIKPGCGAEFIKEAIGHREGCKLDALLKAVHKQ
jgi:hypothetical protein